MNYFKIFVLLCFSQNVIANVVSNFEVKVAIVDVQTILENSIAIQGIRKSIEAISSDIQKYISSKETEFKKLEEELIKKRGTLSEELFEKEVKALEQKADTIKKEIHIKKTNLEKAHSDAIERVHEETIGIISELSKDYKFNLVLPSSQVLFTVDNLNITSRVIEILNNRLKSVNIEYTNAKP